MLASGLIAYRIRAGDAIIVALAIIAAGGGCIGGAEVNSARQKPLVLRRKTPRNAAGLGSEISRAGFPASSEAFLDRLRLPLGDFPFKLMQ